MILKKETYSLQAASYIRSCIRSGELSPGDPVREAFLAQRLGISRAPIREALFSLAQEGLICAEPQKGKYVRSMSAAEILDSYVVAGILEGAGVAASLPRWTENDHEHFREVVASLQKMADHAKQLDELADMDDLFHSALLSCCPNTRLVEMARTSCATISKYLYYQHWIVLFTPQEFLTRHLALADAVFAGKPSQIEKVLRAHYRETGIRMSQHVHDSAPSSRRG